MRQNPRPSMNGKAATLRFFAFGLVLALAACQNPADSPAPEPTVSLASQSGSIASGTPGSVNFAATTANVADDTAGSVSWYVGPDGNTVESAPTGIAATVSPVQDDAATVTLSADATAATGSYYFKLTEGSAVSAVAILTIAPPLTPVVSLGTQAGSLTSGTAGSATFTATTANVAAGTTGAVDWKGDAGGTTTAAAPTGVSASVSAVSADAATVTITADVTAVGGTYYFTLTEGSAVSAVAALTVFTPTAALGTQSGVARNGKAGSASYAATTTHVASGTVGTIGWYTSGAGTTATGAPVGVTPSVSAVSDGSATVTMNVAATAAMGSYYFKLSEGQAASAVATLTIHPSYAVYVTHVNDNNLRAYAMDAATGTLSPLPGSPYATGEYPFSLTVDPAGEFAYVVNFTSDSISAYSIDSLTGGLSPVPGSPFATADRSRSVNIAPSGRFAYVPAGYSAVYAHAINAATGAIGAQIAGSPFAAAEGVNYIALSPNGKFAYATNTLAKNISAFSVDSATGALSAISGSPFAVANNETAALAIDPTGRFLYVGEDSSYGSGKLCAYAIDAAGALSPIAGSPFDTGIGSRTVTADPKGKFLFAATTDGYVYAYAIDPATGALTQATGSPFASSSSLISIAIDPRGKFAYCADISNALLYAYSIDPTTGALAGLPGFPISVGNGPRAITVVELQ